MKKKILLVLSLALTLTSCFGKKDSTQDQAKNQTPTEEISQSLESIESVESAEGVENAENEKKEEKEVVKEDPNPYQDIYDELEGKKFYLDPGTSMVESIYFYEDGYFDGMNKSGDGNRRGISLYNGKFDIVEKIDDTTYKMKLVRLDYDEEPGKMENISYDGLVYDVYYGETNIFGDSLGDYFNLLLPYKKISEVDQTNMGAMEMSGYHANRDILGRFAIGKDNGTALMEFIESEWNQ